MVNFLMFDMPNRLTEHIELEITSNSMNSEHSQNFYSVRICECCIMTTKITQSKLVDALHPAYTTQTFSNMKPSFPHSESERCGIKHQAIFLCNFVFRGTSRSFLNFPPTLDTFAVSSQTLKSMNS